MSITVTQAYRFALDPTTRQVRVLLRHAGAARVAYNWGLARIRGPRVGFPWFKSRRKQTPSVRFTTGTIRCEDDRRHVTLPRLGTIKTHESTRKLHRRIADGRARILSATVRAEAGGWFASFTVEVQRAEETPARPGAVLGVDLGAKTLAVFSAGRPPVQNPKHYEAARRELARLSRAASRKQGPDRRTGAQPSNRWRKANAARNRVHHRVTNLRGDAIHKLTTALARTYGTVVVEDLNVAGMVKNRRLARVISDAGFGEIRRQLTYKTTWHGGRLIVADRWYPSSKTCSGCGVAKTKLRLSERTYVCTTCGLVMDRDENAAIDLASLMKRVVAGSGPETQNGRRADPETRPVRAGGDEASAPHRAVPAQVRRGPSPSDGRITEIHLIPR